MTPGRLYVLCMTAATLVRTAYGYGPATVNPAGRGRAMDIDVVYGLGVEDGLRVRGGPDWVRSQRYTVEAAAGGAFDAETLRGPMLRALLERRFGLKAHIETEQMARGWADGCAWRDQAQASSGRRLRAAAGPGAGTARYRCSSAASPK
jgi:hypothetical protein